MATTSGLYCLCNIYCLDIRSVVSLPSVGSVRSSWAQWRAEGHDLVWVFLLHVCGLCSYCWIVHFSFSPVRYDRQRAAWQAFYLRMHPKCGLRFSSCDTLRLACNYFFLFRHYVRFCLQPASLFPRSLTLYRSLAHCDDMRGYRYGLDWPDRFQPKCFRDIFAMRAGLGICSGVCKQKGFVPDWTAAFIEPSVTVALVAVLESSKLGVCMLLEEIQLGEESVPEGKWLWHLCQIVWDGSGWV